MSSRITFISCLFAFSVAVIFAQIATALPNERTDVTVRYIPVRGVESQDNRLVKRPTFTDNNKDIFISIIQTNGALTAAICASTVYAQAVYGCLAAAILNVFVVFFSGWILSGRADTPPQYGPTVVPLIDMPSVAGSRYIDELKKVSPEGQWIDAFHVLHGEEATLHVVQFKQEGGVFALQSVVGNEPRTGILGKRQPESDEGGMVATYLWQNNNHQAYNDFGSNQGYDQGAAFNAGQYLYDNKGILACADFGDQDGKVDQGLLAVGWNNQPYEFADGQSQAELSTC